jgi:hypothetical protein
VVVGKLVGPDRDCFGREDGHVTVCSLRPAARIRPCPAEAHSAASGGKAGASYRRRAFAPWVSACHQTQRKNRRRVPRRALAAATVGRHKFMNNPSSSPSSAWTQLGPDCQRQSEPHGSGRMGHKRPATLAYFVLEAKERVGCARARATKVTKLCRHNHSLVGIG